MEWPPDWRAKPASGVFFWIPASKGEVPWGNDSRRKTDVLLFGVNCMRTVGLCCLWAATLWADMGAHSSENRVQTPGCTDQSPKQCVDLALDAMGGRERLQQIRSVRLQTIGHTALAEQSYRQDPFITSYESGQTTLDLANHHVLREAKLSWPEADPNEAEVDTVWVAGANGCVRRTKAGDSL